MDVGRKAAVYWAIFIRNNVLNNQCVKSYWKLYSLLLEWSCLRIDGPVPLALIVGLSYVPRYAIHIVLNNRKI